MEEMRLVRGALVQESAEDAKQHWEGEETTSDSEVDSPQTVRLATDASADQLADYTKKV